MKSPVGCAELCDVETWRQGLSAATREQREHVTGWLHHGFGAMKLEVVGYGERFVVDTEEDFNRVERVVSRLTKPVHEHAWHEICRAGLSV